MKKVLNTVFIFLSLTINSRICLAEFNPRTEVTGNQAVAVSCYDNDALDVINQNGLLPRLRVGFPNTLPPQPSDCNQGPAVGIEYSSGNARSVLVNGRKVYDSFSDYVIEVKVSPLGFVGIRTSHDQIHLYSLATNHTTKWYSGSKLLWSFKLARNGALAALTSAGELVSNRGVSFSSTSILGLYATPSNGIYALRSDGRILDQNENTVYNGSFDGAVAVKVSASGDVVYLTEQGRIYSKLQNQIYSGSFGAAQSFKINERGRVAYLTSDGRLGRDHSRLYSNRGNSRITDYRILADGSVTATDEDGHSQYFAP